MHAYLELAIEDNCLNKGPFELFNTEIKTYNYEHADQICGRGSIKVEHTTK